MTTPQTTTIETIHKIEEDDGFIRETQIFGKFGTVRIDKIPDSYPTSDPSPSPAPTAPSSTASVESVPIFHPEDEVLEDHTVKSSLNPSELDFLALISGSRVDNRPFNIKNNTEEFGSRQQSSTGNSFQFGNVQVIGEKVSNSDQPRAGVPRAFDGNNPSSDNSFESKKDDDELKRKIAEERKQQLAEEERLRMEKIREQNERTEAERKRKDDIER